MTCVGIIVSVVGVVGPHKTIITGPKGKSLHKEELTLSQAERDVHHRIKTNAPHQQRHASNKLTKTTNHPVAAVRNPPNATQDTTGKHKTPSQDTTGKHKTPQDATSISQDTTSKV